MNAGKRGLFDHMITIIQTRAPAMRETPEEAAVDQSAARRGNDITFSHSTCRGRLVQLPTANEFGGLEFGRLTYPARPRPAASVDGFCRISGEGEVKLAELDI